MSNDQERRRHQKLREIFEEAYIMVTPFLDPKQSWGNKPMLHTAHVAIHERYADLSLEETNILLNALQRIYIERHPHL